MLPYWQFLHYRAVRNAFWIALHADEGPGQLKETQRYILTFCIWLSSERDIIVPLMDEREQTRNFSLCLRHQSACRCWVLCNFYFLHPWVIACLSACMGFFFTTLSRACLCILCIAEWLFLFLMHNEKVVSYVRVYFFLFVGVANTNL